MTPLPTGEAELLRDEVRRLERALEDSEQLRSNLEAVVVRLRARVTELEEKETGPRLRDHVFVPGDARFGWGLQCRVPCPVREAGQWVTAHCGYPPEDHQATTDPQHADDCCARVHGTACDCWASGVRP